MYYNTSMELPQEPDWGFKFKRLLITASEQLQSSSKVWFIVLAVIAAAAIPAGYILRSYAAKKLISGYVLPQVTNPVAGAKSIEALKTETLETGKPGVYSAYAQVRNPNAEFSAREFTYRFAGQPERQSYLLPGESRFLILPAFAPVGGATAGKPAIQLVIDKVRWTASTGTEVKFEVLQKQSGVTAEGNFFVEGLVKNLQAWRLRVVAVSILVFDRQNQKIIAANATEMTDLVSYESRYFRALWPAAVTGYGQISVIAAVNPLDPGGVLDVEEGISPR